MFTKILCPTDGSEHADKAVALASDLAVKYDAELVLMHVSMTHASTEDLERFASVEGLGRHVRPERERMMDLQRTVIAASAPVPAHLASAEVIESIAKHVLDHAKGVAEAKGVAKVSTVIDDGDAGKRIVKRAGAEGVDAIVMGSRGLGDVKALFLGSVSHYVASHARCTCITVR